MFVAVEIEQEVNRRVDTLFSSLPPLLLFSFSLSLLFCTLLGAFLGGCNARYDIVERVVDYSDGLNLWRALDLDKFPEDRRDYGGTYYTGRPSLSSSGFQIWLGLGCATFGGNRTHFSNFHDIWIEHEHNNAKKETSTRTVHRITYTPTKERMLPM
jgi:hypothetical protein